MALSQLEERMSRALGQMSNASVIDDQVLNLCLEEIASALRESDVNRDLVLAMQANIKHIVTDHDFAAGEDKLRFIKLVWYNITILLNWITVSVLKKSINFYFLKLL